jgi:CHAT domain-containing protein
MGTTPIDVELHVPEHEPLFIEAGERGIDVLVEASEPGSADITRADNPIRRTGTRRLVYGPGHGSTLRIHVTGKEHPAVKGQVSIRVFGRGSGDLAERCSGSFRLLAAADGDYASGQDVTLGRSVGAHLSARHFYLRAAEGYLAVYRRHELSVGSAMAAEAAHALAATMYQDVKDWRSAADWAVRARDAARAAGDQYSEARAEALLAASWIESPPTPAAPDAKDHPRSESRFDETRALLRRLETFHARRGEAYDAALQYNNIGLAFFNEAAFDRAEVIYRGAARRFAALHETPQQGLSLQNVATCEWGRGELTRAERTFQLASRYLGPSPYPKAYLVLLSNHALINHELGHLDTALRLESEALRMAEHLELRIPIGIALHGLGITYYALGDREQSRYYLERAALHHTPDVRSYVSTLRALATVYREAGRPADSRRVATEALALATSASAQARIRVGLALDDAALGRRAEALAALDQILAGAAAHNVTIEVDALLARGDVRHVAGDLAGAQADFQATLGLLGSLEDPTSKFHARLSLSKIHRARGEGREALQAVDGALRLADLLRRHTANPELRAQRQEPLRAAYDLKIALLLDRRTEALRTGDAANAEQAGLDALVVAEESRAQSLADFSAQSVRPADASGMGADIRRRAQLYTEIAGRQYQLDARRDIAGDEDPRARSYQAELASLRRDLDGLNAALARENGRAFVRPSPAPAEWVLWLRQHAPRTAILEFWLGEASASAWVISSTGVEVHALGDSAAITTDALALHASMRDFAATPVATRRKLTETLYERILGPLGADVLSHRSLIIIPDRALAYVPYPSLLEPRDAGRQPLIADHDIAVAPAAWWLFRRDTVTRGSAAVRRVLIVADPVYEADDTRLAAARAGALRGGEAPAGQDRPWTRLRWTAQEAEHIAALFPQHSVERLEGLTATRERMLALPLGEYRYIHVASHGYVDARLPQLSAVILGAYDDHGRTADQSIRAADLLPLRLRTDVVTFSACDTALGKDVVGEGVIGLSYVALARGARAVVASLWQVSDEMTVTIMTEFYRSLLKRPDAAAALGNAMRLALRQTPELDPALWAAYQVAIGGPLPARPNDRSADVSPLREDR